MVIRHLYRDRDTLDNTCTLVHFKAVVNRE